MNQKEKISFTEEFLKIYLANGLGSLPKSEIDLLVFHLLVSSSDYSSMSNYQLAGQFKIPESKIKSMRLNSALKYENIDSNEILKRIAERIANSDQLTELQSGKVEISLENPVEQRELENFLKKQGHFAEYTLNTEVLRISPLRLFQLIVSNVVNGEREFDRIIRENIDDEAQQIEVINNARSLGQKINSLRRQALSFETMRALAIAAVGILAHVGG